MAVVAIQAVFSGDTLPTASDKLPAKQQVIAFLVETIDWYHGLSVQQQIANEQQDILFLEDNRPISPEIVRLSFDFAKAAAAFVDTASPIVSGLDQSTPVGLGFELKHLIELQKKSESEAVQAREDIESLKLKSTAAGRVDRQELQSKLERGKSRLELLEAISGSYQSLLAAIQATEAGGAPMTHLESFADDLARTVPEVSGSSDSSSSTLPQNLSVAAVPRQASSGILEQISEVSALARKRRVLDEGIRLTNHLLQSSRNLQTPLAAPLKDALNDGALLGGASAQSNDLTRLEHQDARLKALTIELKQVSPAITALAKQRVLLALYGSHLAAWRDSIQVRDKAAWQLLVVRLSALSAVIAVLIAIAAVSHRLIMSHFHDLNSRRTILLGQWIALWVSIALIISFAFAFDVRSLGTFLGLLTAGIAVALQNVIVAVAGYFVLVGKLRIRIGDRVQISGVTGEVTEIGLVQFQLIEIDTTSQRPTGRVVSFSNSFVFVSPATGLFKLTRPPEAIAASG